ncbi:hypothetical protein I4U23_001472 [Adineta vaga]|nr:hypothetical protein I4U23_001472 [Adineta vaga]
MKCITCEKHLPTNNYALVEGIYFCLDCFLEQHANLPILNQNDEIRLSSQNRTTSTSQNILTASTTSLNSARSNRISGAARRLSTTIVRTFQQLGSSASPNHQKPPRPPKTRHRQTCQVCFDDKSTKDFHTLSNHTCLQAQRTICNACIYRHIQQAFQEFYTDDVRCPELGCNTKLNYNTIKNILISNKDKKLLERYDRFLVQHDAEQLDDFIWCSNPKCQMGQLNEGGRSMNIVTCVYCKTKTCFIHRIPWHQGLTCDEYDASINDEHKASLQWLNQNTKTCPNCPYQIEKNDGCDHMTCIKCQYEFCWSCLADYEQIRQHGNHQHHPNCKHYANYPRG